MKLIESFIKERRVQSERAIFDAEQGYTQNEIQLIVSRLNW